MNNRDKMKPQVMPGKRHCHSKLSDIMGNNSVETAPRIKPAPVIDCRVDERLGDSKEGGVGGRSSGEELQGGVGGGVAGRSKR